MQCDVGFLTKWFCWVAVCVSWASWGIGQDLPAPALDIPVDVDGDGLSSFSDVYIFNWWLGTGASAKDVLENGNVNDGIIDLSEYFQELGAAQGAEVQDGQIDGMPSDCNGYSEVGLTERMPPNALTTNGQQPTGGTSEHARVTPQGCFVVFSSAATNLPGANTVRQIYRLEYQNGDPVALTNMSQGITGLSADKDCYRPSVSDDGAKVAFESISRMGYPTGTDPDRLPGGYDMGDRDIFIRDTSGTGQTRLLSLDPGQTAANGPSFFSAVSGDGAWVAFTSKAIDFGGGFEPDPTLMNVYRASTDAPGGAEIVSVAPNSSGIEVLSDDNMQTAQNNQGGIGSVGHVISPDGSVVAFDGWSWFTWQGELSSAEGWRQVFVRDARNPVSEQTRLVSQSGAQADSRSPSISPLDSPSLRAAYSTNITDLGPNGVENIYTADLDLDTGEILDREKISMIGNTHGNAHSIVPTLSRTGDFVAFASEAANLVANDTNADRDVFLKKITGPKVLRRSSVKSDGSQVNGTSVESTSPDVTEDGAAVVFESTQTQLVPDDTNGYRDVFRRYELFLNDFMRADANQDGQADISDAQYMLAALFQGGEWPDCEDAADVQDDGKFDLSDPVYLLAALFQGGPDPKPPYDVCGIDPTADTLPCASYRDDLCPD
jgi:Tol biopolymer transport system component